MKVAVWDTYVTKNDGTIMHFDIIVPAEQNNEKIIYGYGKEYLKSKAQEAELISSKECRLCHFEMMKPQWEKDIKEKGYFIYEMENCT